MDYQVVLSASERADLQNIVRYVSADAPERAVLFGQFLVSHTKLLARFPDMGRVVPEFDSLSFVRSLFVVTIE